MQENQQFDTVKEIKKSFLNAFDYLGHQNQEEKQRVLKAIKKPGFHNSWLQQDEVPSLVRKTDGWDKAHQILKGIFWFFTYGGLGLLIISGVLATLALFFMGSPVVLMSLVVFSMAAGIGGACFLGAGLLFGLFSFIPKAVVKKLDQEHHITIITAVLEITNITTLDGRTYVRDFEFLLSDGLNNRDFPSDSLEHESTSEYSDMEDLLSPKKPHKKIKDVNLEKMEQPIIIISDNNQNPNMEVIYKPKRFTNRGVDVSEV